PWDPRARDCRARARRHHRAREAAPRGRPLPARAHVGAGRARRPDDVDSNAAGASDGDRRPRVDRPRGGAPGVGEQHAGVGGAALDVFTHEPLDPSSPYWELPNVIITPHTSGAIDDYWTPLIALFSENLRRFERGAPLLNLVDKAAGY